MERLRAGEWIALAGGIALLASLFLHWYRRAGGGSEATAWQAFSVLDVVLALAALLPLALGALQATRDSPTLPVTLSVLTTLAGALATLLVVYRMLDQPGANDRVELQPGAWLGLAAAALTVVGGWRSLRAESIPGVPLPPVQDLPVPSP